MNFPERLRVALRDLFSPGPAAYDERRSRRVLIWTIVGAILFAVAFGFALYHLNSTGRLNR